MTKEARGAGKRPENLRWLVHLARQQQRRLGRAYLDFGEPIPLKERLAELRADPATGEHAVERIALDIMHRINRATPVTATAVVSLARWERTETGPGPGAVGPSSPAPSTWPARVGPWPGRWT